MKPIQAVALLSDYREGGLKPLFVVAAVVMEDGHAIIATGSTAGLPPDINDELSNVLTHAVNAPGKAWREGSS